MATLDWRRAAVIGLVFGALQAASPAASPPAAKPAMAAGVEASVPYPHGPAWIADQTLYEVNLRQFSAEGNVEGFAKQLPRLKDLGVGTLWFMPVQPIGVASRSGTLGSPYAPIDYLGFNPEFGTVEQFKATIDQAHRLGMFVLIDWVATHTSPDHPWVAQHPDWYKRDAQGQLVHPQPTWLDVVALNYEVPALRKAMIDAMTHWVRDVGVDGFRCDSAEFVPDDFWVTARDAMRAIKPVFMLAEANKPALMNYAFDATYAWNLSENMEGIVKGTKSVTDLVNYLKAEATVVPGDGFRLNFTTNHDKNAWEGTTREQLKDGVNAFAVLTFTLTGMPLIYNGQENGVERRLSFFERDPIAWRADPTADLYRTLARLKRDNWALWNGLRSAPLQVIGPSTTNAVLTFKREANGDRVLVMLNLSAQAAAVPMPADVAKMRPVLGPAKPVEAAGKAQLQPWEYRVWSSTQ